MIDGIKFKFWLTMVLLVFGNFAFAQDIEATDEEIDEIIDNLIAIDDEDLIDLLDDLDKYQIIFASIDYNDKTYFLGRDIGIDLYNFSPQIMYENSNGIFLGVNGTYYSEFDPKWDLTVVSAGYGINFGKKDNFRAEAGYSRYFFSDIGSNDFENSIDFDLGFSTTNGEFGSNINTSYLFGSKTGFLSSISVYGDVHLFYLNTSKGFKVSFGPDLSFILGSENIDTSRIDNLGINIPFINRIVDSFETFSLRNIQLQLPITIELNEFYIEAGYNVNFPKAFEFENDLDSTSFFNLGVSYMFALK